MTAIAMREDHAALEPFTPTPRETAAVVSLIEWAQQAQAANQLAEVLCRTSFVPAHFRGKPHETAAAIMTGAEVGLSPMAALRSIFVISGTPGMYARTMVALVQSRGHEVWVVEQSDEKVTVGGLRRGSDKPHFSTWDRARVVKAGLQSNAKYQTTPQQMLYARASSEICRQIASDVLLGIPYSVEELWDMPPEVEPRARLTAADVMGAAPAIEQREPTDAEVVDEPPVAMMADGQKRKLFAVCNELGFDDEQRLTFCSMVLNRDVDTTETLTRFDAGTVLDALDAELARRRNAQREASGDDWPVTAEVPGDES